MHSNPPSRLQRLTSRRGIAIVIVLCAMVMLTVLAVGFFSSVQNEAIASAAYSSGMRARILGESAVQLVAAQLREATKLGNQSWTSQPGMIRTYSMSGTQVAAFKLYSAMNAVS